ncbi:MAG TPA: alpha/beta hydrolase, partial [Phaeodactylibacter sp.]|nr:alpha/beta hydrolase [Phaeodactylibacter sp.]
MKKQNEFTWKTKNKQKIHGYDWKVAEAKAVVCLVHGLGEHMHRYDSMAAYYNQKGYAMMAFDNLGHGKSGGK